MNYLSIQSRIKDVAKTCGRDPQEIQLVTVTKSHPVDAIKTIYDAGGRLFGESRSKEAEEKISHLPNDCEWHFIGTLQKNKVAKVISRFSLIHSVDSVELAQVISKHGLEQVLDVSVLLQVNVTGELSKHGLSPNEWEKSLDVLRQLPCLKIKGLMTMAPLTDDLGMIRDCFRKLRQLRDQWKIKMADPDIFKHLSMGMSHDYEIAIAEGATLVRIGSAIFNKELNG